MSQVPLKPTPRAQKAPLGSLWVLKLIPNVTFVSIEAKLFKQANPLLAKLGYYYLVAV